VTGKTLSRVGEAPIGHWSQGAVFSPDGKTILVGNMVEKDYWVFRWTGAVLKDTGQRVKVNGGPAAIRAAEK
jgi:DNA-binding beta-propeller fold protein YncE